MRLVSISKYEKLLELCCEIHPELKADNIKIVKDNTEFSVNLYTNEIHIKDKLENKFNKKMKEYISSRFNLNINNIPMEVFAFFHEIGHVFHNYMYYSFDVDLMTDYIAFDSMYLSENDSFLSYRNIYYEYLSDIFATDIILNYEKEILTIIRGY